MTYQTYEFTAFTEADLLGSGGTSCGATFTVPATGSVCMTVTDDDGYLNGDSICNENSDDQSGQYASIEGANGEVGNGGQIYAEVYHWVYDSAGNWYLLIEIEQEGASGDYFSFHEAYGVPAEGETLTFHSSCNITDGGWAPDYNCLNGGEKPEPAATGAICGRVTEDADCDDTEFAAGGGYDEGLAGQTVELYGWDGSSAYLVATTTTNADGSYDFPNLEGGWYYVQFDLPEGSEFAAKDVGVEHADSDANSAGRTDWICLEDGQVKLNVDASIKPEPVPTGAICGRVTNDVDCDDTEFAAAGGYDEGLGGQTVELYGWDGSSAFLVATTTTNTDGSYDFPALEGGWYYVKFELPEGGEFAAQNVGVEHADSDSDEWGYTDWICLADGQVQLNVDASIKFPVETGSISGTVWCDEDCDGLQGTETVVEGCDYTIEAEHMQKYGFTTVSGTQASADCLVKLNCAGGWGDLTTSFHGKDGTYDVTIWVQDENDGQSTIKLKVNGVLVEAVRLDADTDGGGSDNGGFSAYVIQDVDLTDGDDITLWVDGDGLEYVRIDKIDLEGQDVVTTTAEPTKAGVEIKLIDADGNVVETTTTDADGNYAFNDVPVGDYTIMGVAPDGTEFTIQDAGSDDSIDSDVNGDGMSGTVTVTADGNVDVDLGVCEKEPELGSISGRYFCDDNNNDRDDGEPGIAEATVWLIKVGSGVIASTTTDADGNYSFGDLEAGDYSVRFEDPNDVAGSEGKTFVDADQGDDINDSDVVSVGGAGNGNTGTITLGEGENKTDVDAGIEDAGTASLAGRYFCDENDDDVDNGEPGIANALVSLLDADGNAVLDAGGNAVTTTTDGNGNYEFTGLKAGDYKVSFAPDADGKTFVAQDDPNGNGDDTNDSDVDSTGTTGVISLAIGERSEDNDAGVEDPAGSAITGRLFCDSDDDNLDNNNGDEAGVGGVTVTLLNGDGTPTGRTTTTASDGSYAFTGLVAGAYMVSFPTDVDGKTLVDQGVGVDTSDVDPTTGLSPVITVGINETSTDNDAGVEDPGTASLGDKVFIDANGNGIQDDGEVGLDNVTVTLRDGNGDIVGTDVTEDGGMYLFENLDAGDYTVEFGEPGGYDFTTQNATGSTEANDSDVNAAGVADTVTLEIGDANRDVDAGVVSEDPTANNDAGMTCANEELTIDVLANDEDVPSETLTITQVGGQDIAEGETVVVGGVEVTLSGGQLVFDGEAAYIDLDIGQSETATISYTISDGLGGSASADVDVTFCGVAETIEEICESLPAQVQYEILDGYANGNSDAYDIRITSTDARLDGLIVDAAYCVSALDPADTGATFDIAPLLTGDLYCTVDPFLPASVLDGQVGGNGQSAADNLDLINWILNQDFNSDEFAGLGFTNGVNDAEVQAAVWNLTDSTNFILPSFGELADVQTIVSLASAQGEGFVAGAGDTVGLIIDPNPATSSNSQPFIIGIEFNDLDCIC